MGLADGQSFCDKGRGVDGLELLSTGGFCVFCGAQPGFGSATGGVGPKQSWYWPGWPKVGARARAVMVELQMKPRVL